MWEKLKQIVLGTTPPVEVNVDEACKAVENKKALLLDVRELTEWQSLRIPHAKHIPLGELEKRVSELPHDKNMRIICHCKSGRRSMIARETLLKLGFKNVSSLHGGILEWKNQGKHVEGADNVCCGCG